MIINGDLLLKGLRFHAFHGVLPQERLTGNDYEVDLTISYDFKPVVKSDDLNDTLNYAEVYEVVKEVMAQPCQLVEHVAGRIGKSIIERWPTIFKVHVTVLKLNPPMGADCKGAGVHLEMTNDEYLTRRF